ncbi:hypothetical protein PSHT_09246 [Puccinia striiformis]|uniref:Uncharacterized protein n=1 Tax=Puccinia striiformis TaxID=27350 RepID=A0A2S4VI93_9BASI|nr:hypothetical protein PSHT_09246 [Puccinia striiformis]
MRSTGTRHQRNHDETRNNDQLGMRIDYIGPEIAGCERQLILRFYAPDRSQETHGPNDHTTDEDAASVSTKVDNPHKLSLHNNLSCHSKPNVQHINTHGLLCRRKRLSAWVQRCKMCELQSSLRPRKWADWAKRLVLMLRRVHGAQTRDWPVDALGMPLRQVDSKLDGTRAESIL